MCQTHEHTTAASSSLMMAVLWQSQDAEGRGGGGVEWEEQTAWLQPMGI